MVLIIPIMSDERSNDMASSFNTTTTTTCNILRSPSHESVKTDISLSSVSTAALEFATKTNHRLLCVRAPSEDQFHSRGPSPNFGHSASQWRRGTQEMWFEEGNDLIRNVAAISEVVGLSKSFSTTDITTLPLSPDETLSKRNAVSDLVIVSNCWMEPNATAYMIEQNKLGAASRTYSTWVAVGDAPSSSQLPSPNVSTSITSNFTPADLIRSVNKKVRQYYIRKRLMVTYKALERLSESQFNLDTIEKAATRANVNISNKEKHQLLKYEMNNKISGNSNSSIIMKDKNSLLTVNDVERDRGQPLSKYDRNMIIFNWLLTLDTSSQENVTSQVTL